MSTPAKKLIVYTVDLNNMQKTEMAHYELHGGVVKAHYKNKLFESTMKDGIHILGKMIKPEDGAKFMLALETNFSRSSTVVVERP